MNRRFIHNFQLVTAIHAGILLAVFFLPAMGFRFRSKPNVMEPAPFTVMVPSSMIDVGEGRKETALVVVPEKRKDDVVIKPNPAVKPDRKVAGPPSKKPGKTSAGPKIKTQAASPSMTPRTPLSAEEIQKLLDKGAAVGEQNSVPVDEDAQCLEVLRRMLYEAWAPPAKQEAGDSVVEVTIRFLPDGTIVGAAVTRKSGKASMDDSVAQAVASVKRIPGLTPGFLRTHESVPVEFFVTEE